MIDLTHGVRLRARHSAARSVGRPGRGRGESRGQLILRVRRGAKSRTTTAADSCSSSAVYAREDGDAWLTAHSCGTDAST